ncbi:MAG: transcription-repair coupling factor [Spirochaetaceae bacterium]
MVSLFQEVLSKKIRTYKPYQHVRKDLIGNQFPIDVYGPKGAFLSLLIGEIFRDLRDQMILVLPTEREAEDLVGDLELFGVTAHLLPWWQTVPYRETPSNSSVFGARARVLSEMLAGEKQVFVTSLRAVLTPVPPISYLQDRRMTVRARQEVDPVDVGRRLEAFGYTRVPRVTVRGEYALRGEVVDVFPAGAEEPVRLVIDFDEISELKTFHAGSQASSGAIDHAIITPMRELTWDEERLTTLEQNLRAAPELAAAADDVLLELSERGRMPGEELLFPLSFHEGASVFDYLRQFAVVVLADHERLRSAAEALEKEYDGLYRRARKERAVPRPARILLDYDEVLQRHSRAIRVRSLKPSDGADVVSFPVDPPRSFFGNVDFLKEELGSLQDAGYDLYVFADSEAQTHRVQHLLSEYEVTVLPASISAGFSVPDLKVAAIQENEIFGRRRRIPRSVKHAVSAEIDTFVELSPGDFVVHVNHGIGKFHGIERLSAGGNERDYICLEYAGEEFIYVPIEQVNMVQRYIGSGGAEPRLDRIGGKSWQSRKSKVKSSVEDLAERLVKLYSKRKKARGFAFPQDTEWQLDFEAAFPYEETEDQLHCIDDVKRDMESPAPMDRLICGDVGYGKTEVAMRAAFKAVAAGKQVAFLAPTTILVEQHYETFQDRFERYAVNTAMLSRFVAKRDQRTVLEGLEGGDIDLVVGTHRLLQKDVKFRNIGLLVVDEEQRFGVKDKERIKELKASVDSLTLTATPIPRTLHMSLLKIRDMSVLNTPPHNRRPIETFIEEFSEERVAQAIRREVARGGQVFYLHNRVETLDNVRRFLQNLLPEFLIEIAHGKMSSHELEDIMHRFVHGGFQVLVSTTIIENGIDIPNVNTIIIDRADMYGISQLYQLRGRVGRSERLAYAYLFYPEGRALSELAMKRLQVISDFTELGSGFKIALKDLEVRGAGNLLGRQQSGDILSVGFDLYVKLLDQAIRELEEQEEEEPPEVYLELDYTGYIPDSYITEPMEKMEVYKKIAGVNTEAELEAVYGELEDRFGPLPEEVQSLLSLAEIKIICRRLFISALRERKGTVEIEFAKVAMVSPERVLSLIDQSGGKVRLDPKRPHALIMDTGSVGLKEKSEFIRSRLSTLL